MDPVPAQLKAGLLPEDPQLLLQFESHSWIPVSKKK